MPDLYFASKGAAEVIRQQTLINEKASELSQIYRDDARAAQELERAAARIFKNTANPAKQFNEEMGKLHGQFRQGKINADQYEKGVKRLEQVYQEANTIGGKLKGTVANMFGPAQMKALTGYVSAFAGVGGLIAAAKLLTAEYQAQIDLINKAAKTQMDVGQARNLVIRNMLGAPEAEIQNVLGRTTKMAGDLALPEPIVAQALAEAMSASGGKADPAFDAVKLAGQYLADQPTEIGGFAGSLIDMQKVTGSPDQRVNFGILAKIGQLSRVATPQAIAMNAPKGLVGANAYGASAQEGAAFYAALTNAMPDPTGAQSATAQVRFAEQLFDFGQSNDHSTKTAAASKELKKAEAALAEKQRVLAEKVNARRGVADAKIAAAEKDLARAVEDKNALKPNATDRSRTSVDRRIADANQRLADARASAGAADPGAEALARDIAKQQAKVATLRSQAAAPEDPAMKKFRETADFSDRIAILQANPALANKFLDNLSIDAAAKGPIRNLLLDPNSRVSKEFADNMGQMPDNAALAALADKAMANFALNPLEPLAATSRSLTSLRDQLRVGETQNLGAEERESLKEILMRLGGSNIGTNISGFLNQLEDGELGISVEETRSKLKDEQDRLLRGKENVIDLKERSYKTYDPPTVEDKKNAELLGDVLKVLEQQLDAQKETNRKLGQGGLIGGTD